VSLEMATKEAFDVDAALVYGGISVNG